MPLPKSIPCLGFPTLPYTWTKKQLPYQIEMGFSLKYAWVSLGQLTKSVYVPGTWRDRVQANWDKITAILRGEQEYDRYRTLPVELRMKTGDSLGDAIGKAVAQHTEISDHVETYNVGCEVLIDEISTTKTRKTPRRITPKQWLKVKDQLQPHGLPYDRLTAYQQGQQLEHFYNFLTDPNEPLQQECTIGPRHRPRLRPDQAEAVLRYADALFGLDDWDIRMTRCESCGEFQASAYHTSFETCEGCGLSVCEGCRGAFFPRYADHSETADLAESHHLTLENYCLHCWPAVEAHVKQLPALTDTDLSTTG